MEASTITIHWHDDGQAVYSANLQPGANDFQRLATAGGDNNVRIWRVNPQDSETTSRTEAGAVECPISVQYLSTLRKHTQAINCCRFSPNGNILATAGDDGTIMLWTLADHIIKDFEDTENEDTPLESWQIEAQLRSSTSEIYDICWSPDGKNLVAGSMDNTLSVYKVDSTGASVLGSIVHSSKSHGHYVQGVCWDPLGECIASQSADRLVLILKCVKSLGGHFDSIKTSHRFLRALNSALYHPETLPSFFRRLAFSPDGAFLLTPAGFDLEMDGPQGSAEQPDTPSVAGNSVYVYLRSDLDNSPTLKLKLNGSSKPAIAVSFSPVKYQSLSTGLTNLPYNMIFAVATQDSVIVYSTFDFEPLCYANNLHYSSITDVAWYPDGTGLIVTSTDGFCSVLNFEKSVFGSPFFEMNTQCQSGESTKTNANVGSAHATIPVKTANTIDRFFENNTITGVPDASQEGKESLKKRITPTLLGLIQGV